jgi:nucleoside-diphosphate-sugar epimerase
LTRALVTGATGFVGRHTLAALARRGFEVHAVARSAGPPEAHVAWHEADLLKAGVADALLRAVEPKQLVHFAWFAKPGEFWSSPENERWLEASTRLLRAFAASGGTRAVIAGTCAEYDWSSGVCVEDETPLVPATLYGRCKDALRRQAEEIADATGMEVAWGRIFFLYGPHESSQRLVPSVTRSLLRGEEAACTEGEQIRDFMHVEDVGDAFAAVLDSEVRGAVNIASGAGTRVRDLVEVIGRMVGRPELIHLGAIAAPPDDPPVLVADITRLQEEVAWTPRFSLEQGVAQTVEWWQRQSAGAGCRGASLSSSSLIQRNRGTRTAPWA